MLTPQQIDLIVKEIIDGGNCQGVLLAGSYAYGKPTAKSDLDLRVITKDGSNFVDDSIKYDTQMEILCNSPERVREYFEEGRQTGDEPAVNFWSKGKIIYDPNGAVSRLQREAQEIREKGPYQGTWKTRPEYLKKMSQPR